ncbi:unknown [Prevotella sp. CAG:617]|nr:unknown [Prevotella sp. CAG:617]
MCKINHFKFSAQAFLHKINLLALKRAFAQPAFLLIGDKRVCMSAKIRNFAQYKKLTNILSNGKQTRHTKRYTRFLTRRNGQTQLYFRYD